MSTLNVTSIQNPAAPQANISLNADGTVTLPVYTGAGAPPLFQAGTLWFDTAALKVRNATNTGWLAVGGGGGGTVTGVTGTAPIVSSGGTAPAISITAATTAAAGSVQLADATASQAGTSATLVSTPAFSVPKDASGMTGAAILPSGTTLQQPATTVVGMTRFNTDSGYEEAYTGATNGWKKIAYVPSTVTPPPDLTISSNTTLSSGIYYVNNLTIDAGVTVTSGNQTLVFICSGSATINGTILCNGVGGKGAPAQTWTGAGLNSAYGVGFGSGNNPYSTFATTVGTGGPNSNVITNTNGTTAGGGNGGGCIGIKAAGAITVGSSVVLSANGSTGGSVTSVSGSPAIVAGCGGGSGGSIILDSLSTITLQAGSSLSAQGGAGGAAAAFGTIGGFTQAEGGKGGGGGVIILQAQGTLSDSSTKSVAGGAAGANAGVAGTLYTAAAGAAFGGSAGSTGVILYSGSPL